MSETTSTGAATGGAGASTVGSAPAGNAATTAGASTAASSATAGASSGASGGGNASWYGSLPDGDTKGWIETKGYKDLASMAESHRNLEKLVGAPSDRVLKLPEKADDPAWGDIYKRLGKPEKSDGYELPKMAAENEDFSKWAKETFHGLNLTKAQAETFAQKWNDFSKGKIDASQEQRVNMTNQQLSKLKQEWGNAYNQNIETVNKIASAMGVTPEQYKSGESALGVDGWAKFLHSMTTKFGVKMDESSFVIGEGSPGNQFSAMSPASAQEKLNRLQKDSDWVSKFMKGDGAARAEWDHLHKQLYPGFTEH